MARARKKTRRTAASSDAGVARQTREPRQPAHHAASRSLSEAAELFDADAAGAHVTISANTVLAIDHPVNLASMPAGFRRASKGPRGAKLKLSVADAQRLHLSTPCKITVQVFASGQATITGSRSVCDLQRVAAFLASTLNAKTPSLCARVLRHQVNSLVVRGSTGGPVDIAELRRRMAVPC